MTEEKPMTGGELVNERIIGLRITYKKFKDRIGVFGSESDNYRAWLKGRTYQISDELEFLELLKKRVG